MDLRGSLFALALALAATGCKTNDVSDGVASAGSAVAEGVQDVASAGTSLVNVNLSNVLNDLALDLNIDKANIPVNAQVPITLAANVCGVSINILSVSTGGSSGGCTATTSSPELAQVVQQQLAAGGNVGGGGQTTGGTSTGTTSGTSTSPTETTTTAPTTGSTTEPQPTTPQ